MGAIHNAPMPTNVKEVRSFVGLTIYISHFSPDYATIMKPMRDLTSKNAEWKWTSEYEAAVHELKYHLTSSMVMAYYNPDLPTQVLVDACPFDVITLLVQHDEKGVSYIVAYTNNGCSVSSVQSHD